nr:MAG TPA: hypothetical protein [Caudoviricetes sp.]
MTMSLPTRSTPAFCACIWQARTARRKTRL